MDRQIPISPQLERWATAISHEYLNYHDPNTLFVNTAYLFNEWIINPVADENMDADYEEASRSVLNDPEDYIWNKVAKKRQSRSESPNKEVHAPTSYTIPGWKSESAQEGSRSHVRPQSRAEQKQYEKLVKPAARPPNGITTVKERDEDEATQTNESTSSGNDQGGSERSEVRARPQSFPNVKVNDGTHRVTVKLN